MEPRKTHSDNRTFGEADEWEPQRQDWGREGDKEDGSEIVVVVEHQVYFSTATAAFSSSHSNGGRKTHLSGAVSQFFSFLSQSTGNCSLSPLFLVKPIFYYFLNFYLFI